MESVLVDFLKWLNKKYAASTSRSRLSRVKRIAKYYDILDEYTNDKCTSLMDDLTFTKSDLDAGGEIKTDIIIKGNYITGLTSLRQALIIWIQLIIVFLRRKKAQQYLLALLKALKNMLDQNVKMR